ncbi:hypothetical protein lerEdw1_001174 [Lerista edwardsae]|nr:hypothetical protein lerEdw1_001174 [Lerista edwardsae]
MVIPNQPPLTATKKSASKPGLQPAPIPVTPVGTLKPQPVPASYTTASTSARPTFNVQVKSAQPTPPFQPPAPQHSTVVPFQAPQPAPPLGPSPYAPLQPRAPDYSCTPQPARLPEPSYGYAPPQTRYQESPYPGGPSYGGRNGTEPSHLPQNAWKPAPGPQAPSLHSKVRKADAWEPVSVCVRASQRSSPGQLISGGASGLLSPAPPAPRPCTFGIRGAIEQASLGARLRSDRNAQFLERVSLAQKREPPESSSLGQPTQRV